MENSVILWRLLIWCVLVSYFCSSVMVVGMPHHELGHLENSPFDQDSTLLEDDNPISEIVAVDRSSPIVTNGNNGTTTAADTNPGIGAADSSTETTAQTTTTGESEPTPITTAIAAGGGTTVNTTIGTIGTTTPVIMEFIPNEISRASSSSSSSGVRAVQQQEVENVVEDAGVSAEAVEFPMNSITPTIAAALSPSSSLPLLPPPPTIVVAPAAVIDPISFQQKGNGNDDETVRPGNDNGVSSTSTTYLASPEDLPFIVPGASSPSIQLVPPPPTTPSSSLSPIVSPDIPREPDQGQLPESPEPHSHHPFNLHDIPISLLSLSGNSGGSTSDMATFSSFVSPTENVPVDYTQFRYHVVTGQLFKIGSTGPGICPKNMRFFAVPGHPKNGACDCDYYQCSRPLIYSPQSHQCYWAWSQGPCDKDEWFVFDKDLRRRGKCEKNPCPSSSSTSSSNDTASSAQDYYFQSPKDDTCYQAGTQGYCADADERLLIYPDEPIPKCRKFTLCYPLTVPQELQCIYGNKYFVESGQCQ